MAKASIAFLLGVASTALACSSKPEHPAYPLPPDPPADAASDVPADASDASDASARDTAPVDTGSIEGPKPDAPIETAPPPPGSLAAACHAFDPATMTIAGALDASGCSNVLASPGDPKSTCFALPCFFDGSAQVRPSDGALLYTYSDSGITSVRQFVPDELPYDAASKTYSYPPRAETNDTVVSKNCDGVANFALDPKTSAMLITCQSTGTYQVLDETGKQLFQDDDQIIGIGWDGHYLLRPFNQGLLVADAAGARNPVVGLPDCDFDTVDRPRAKPTGGFWVIARFGGPSWTHERWSIANDGTATKDGVFAGYPADAGDEYNHHLDAKGEMWSVATITGKASQKRVYRHSLSPGPTTVMYDDSLQPASDWTNTGELRVTVGFGYLATGP